MTNMKKTIFKDGKFIKVYVFEAAKYQGKWAVYDTDSRTFSHIGAGKKFCEKKATQLNNELVEIFNDPLLDDVKPNLK